MVVDPLPFIPSHPENSPDRGEIAIHCRRFDSPVQQPLADLPNHIPVNIGQILLPQNRVKDSTVRCSPGARPDLQVDAVLPFRTALSENVALFVIYGVFYSVDEAQSKAFIADIELERRASAIGVYNFVTGIIYLPASLIAGALWLLHPASAFIVAACFAFFAIAAFVIVRPDLHRVSGVFPG